MPHTHIETSTTGFQGVPHDDHNNLKIHRLYDERPVDKSHYMMTWFGEIDAGHPILGHFFGPTVIYIVEGEFQLDEKSTGKITKLVTGDVLHIDQESYITWSSPSKGKAFAVSYAPTTAHPEDIVVQPVSK
jgi:hypothetical protein